MTAYLDWNATSPPHETVLEAMRRAAEFAWANPASVHELGRRARDQVESARELLGAVLDVEARDVILTGGGTEANHLALSGATRIITSRLEHPSIVREAERLAGLGTLVEFVDVTPSGLVDVAAIEAALGRLPVASSGDETRLGRGRSGTVVAVMAANHETGVLQPLEAVARVAREGGAWLHVDAVQLLGRASLAACAFADSVAVAAHKVRGPKGLGALGLRQGRRVVARGLGGSQERGFRAGTVDAVACAGFAAALGRVEDSVTAYGRTALLRDHFEAQLRARAGRRLTIHGADAPRLPNVSNFGLEGERGDELVAALDLLGVQVSSGSACAAGTAEPSPVIAALVGRDAARTAVRVSFGETSTADDERALLEACERLGLLQNPSSST